MEKWIGLLAETLLDGLKMLPFLFAAYLLIEYIEQYHSAKLQKALAGNSRYGFAVGSALGLVPQCGFSAMAADLYAAHVITPGTLLAVFLSTSDEALPLLLSDGALLRRGGGRALILLLAGKLVLALVCGWVTDRLANGRWGGFSGRQEDCDCHDHHENEKVLPAALRHTAQVFALVLGLSLALAVFLELVGQDWLRAALTRVRVWQVPLAALVGLVPNCAVSVLLTELYLDGLISFGALFAGLASGAGVGLIVLWRTNPAAKENARLTALLTLCAMAGGWLIQLLPL